MEDVHVRTDTHSCRGIIGWRSINHYSQSDFTACILVQYDHKIFIDLFFASLFLLVIDIISDVISMSGSRLIVCVCVCVVTLMFEQFFL